MSNHWKTLKQQFCEQSMYDTSIIQSVLSDGYDLASKDEHGRTLLHYVHKLPAVKYLMKHTPSIINIQDNYGNTPLFYILCKNYCEDPSIISYYDEWDNEQHDYTCTDNDIILYMLEHGADPFIENTRGFNCVHTFCIMNTMPEYIKDAIVEKCSGRLNQVVDEDHLNPLYTAASRPCYESAEIIKYLLKVGVTFVPTEDDESPLEYYIKEYCDDSKNREFVCNDEVTLNKFKQFLKEGKFLDTIKVFDQDCYKTFNTDSSLYKKILMSMEISNEESGDIHPIDYLKNKMCDIVKKHDGI